MKKSLTLSLLSIAIISMINISGYAEIKSNTGVKQLFGYYANWDTYGRNYQPSDMPINDLTGVIYAFAEVGNCAAPFATDQNPTLCNAGAYAKGGQDYKLYSSDPYSDFNIVPASDYNIPNNWPNGLGNMAKTINAAHAQQKAALLSIGGFTLSVPLTTAMTPEHQQAFIQSIIYFLNQVKDDNKGDGFDGVDIDWEPHAGQWDQLTDDQINNYVSFLQNLKTQLEANYAAYAWVTIALPANPDGINKVGAANWQKIAAAVDYINVMSYDYHGGFDNPPITNYLAPLHFDANQPSNVTGRTNYNIDSTLQALTNMGVPKNKIIVGFPAYGRAVEGVTQAANNGTYQSFTGTPNGEWNDGTGMYDYQDIVLNLLNNGYSSQENATVAETSAFNPATGFWMSYDSVNDVKSKANYVLQNGYAGMMTWELSGDVPPSNANYDNYSLVHTAAESL